MSLNHSPSIVTDGLILALDAANRKSYIGAAPASLINTNSWTIGSGSVDGYGQNGNTEENTRLYDTDPWGNQSIVWGTYASGDNGADGGWNTNYVSIDPTKLYRFSVWVRRTSSTAGGTFYFGTGAGGGEVRGTSDSATKGNPYWECSGTAFVQNQWHLVCGHIYPHFSTYTGRHPNTGYFTIATGANTLYASVNGCNIGSDLKWDSASNSATHRTYHYYCGDSTTRLQFFAPRIDMCDGNEPSISELLSNGSSVWKDVSGNNNHFTMNGSISFNRTTGFSGFDGNNLANGNKFYRASFPQNLKTSQGGLGYTTMVLAQSTGGTGSWRKLVGNGDGDNYIDLYQSPGGVWHQDGSGESLYYNNTSVANDTQYMPDSVWRLYSATNLNSGTLTNPVQNFSIGNEPASNAYPWIGNIQVVLMYNRVLSITEITQNFNALRGRYGI